MKNSRDEILRFLNCVDGKLSYKIKITIVGGTAGILSNLLDQKTHDVDVISSTAWLREVWEEVVRESGINLALETVAVGSPPEDYEDRLEQIGTFKFLQVEVLEAHDLVLMKAQRFNSHDRQHIQEIHRSNPLNPEILFSRFDQDWRVMIGDKLSLRGKYLSMIGELFDQETETNHEERLPIL